MNLRAKLFLGFGLIVVATAALGVSALLTYDDVGQEFDLLQKDVVPGAISLLETNMALKTLLSEAAEMARSEDTTNREHADAAIIIIQSNTAEHTTHELQIGEEEGQVAQDMENRATSIISLAEEVMDTVPVAASAKSTFDTALSQMYAESEALESIFEEHVAEHMSELAEVTGNIDDSQTSVQQTFNLLVEDTVPMVISIMETEVAINALYREVEQYARIGIIEEGEIEEIIETLQENTEEHTVYATQIGEEERLAAQDMENRIASIITLAQRVLASDSETVIEISLDRMVEEIEDIEPLLEEHVDEHVLKLDTVAEDVDSIQATLQQEITLLQEDIVPGAISILETNAALARVLAETETYVRTGDSNHWEHAEEAITLIQTNTVEHTTYATQIGEKEGLTAQDMEDRAASVVSLARRVKTAADNYTSALATLADSEERMHSEAEALAVIFDKHVAEHMDELDTAGENVNQAMATGTRLVWFLIASTLILAIGVGVYISWSVLKPLALIQQGTERIGSGDLGHRLQLERQDELGQLATAFNSMTENLQHMVKTEQDSRSYLENTIGEYMGFVGEVSDGNLAAQLSLDEDKQDAQDDLYRLGANLNVMVMNLRTMAAQVRESATSVSSAATEIQAATTQQMATAAEQDAAVTQTVATVEEVRATIAQTAERAQNVADSSQQAIEVSRDGRAAVEDTVDGMDLLRQRVESIAENILLLSERTQQIGEIIETVNALADQSKLLALNASIEAARAGEEGKGFAVVAMEVRQLAEQSREATARVRDILSEIQQATNTAVMVTEEGSKGAESGMEMAQRAGETIGELTTTIEGSAQSATQIAASTHQQINGIDQLAAAMMQIKQAASQTAASTKQAEQSVRDLNTMARQLDEAAAQYKL